jgi:nicotinamide mononucleotide transporter
MTLLEITANGFNAASIFLASRNSVHTWWTGVIGCALFGLLFWSQHLYADANLQGLFILTSFLGWAFWMQGKVAAPITKMGTLDLLVCTGTTTLATLVLQSYLKRYTNDVAPMADALIFTGSLTAQFLLMLRFRETWIVWLIVNSVSIPLLISRELYLSAALYGAFWVNAFYGFQHWKRLEVHAQTV